MRLFWARHCPTTRFSGLCYGAGRKLPKKSYYKTNTINVLWEACFEGAEKNVEHLFCEWEMMCLSLLPDIKSDCRSKSFIDLKYVSHEHVNTLWRCLASSLNDSVEVAESLND